jgi:hypothetical protein
MEYLIVSYFIKSQIIKLSYNVILNAINNVNYTVYM